MALLEVVDGKPVFPLWAIVIEARKRLKSQNSTLLEGLAHDHFVLDLEKRVDRIAAHIASAAIQNHPLGEAIKTSTRNRISHLRGALEVLKVLEHDAHNKTPTVQR